MNARRAQEDGLGDRRDLGQYMLAVVEQHQPSLLAQRSGDRRCGRLSRRQFDPEGGSDRRRHARRVGHCRQFDPLRSVFVVRLDRMRHGQGQPCLADAARPGNRHQRVGGQQRACLGQVCVATDQRRQSVRQSAPRRRHRLRRAGSGSDHRRAVVVEVGDELVAAARDRRDRLRPQQLAQRRDLHLQVVLLDHQPGPHGVEQFVLGDDAIAAPHQHQQHVDRACAELRRFAVDVQQPPRRIELEAAEADFGDVGIHGIDEGRTRASSLLQRVASERFRRRQGPEPAP